MDALDSSEILSRVFKQSINYPIDREQNKLKSERRLKEFQHFRR